MKKVLKLLFLFIIGLSTLKSSGQSVGVIGGLSLADMTLKDNGETFNDNYKMNPVIHLGVTFEYSFSDYLSLETGLLFNMKGFKQTGVGFDTIGLNWSQKLYLFYLDIPVKIKGSYAFSDGFKIYGAIGPFFGMGLYGKHKSDIEDFGFGDVNNQVVEWGNDPEHDEFKRPDFGVTFGAGTEIKGFQIGINYDLGLINISTYIEDGLTMRNNILRFTFGYCFNLGKKSKHAETPVMQDGAYTPVLPSGYANYSYPELVNLQNQAVQAEDFEKAQKIQDEIIRRESQGMFKDIPVERLEQLLNEAVNAQDYSRAARIKNELESRRK